MKFTLKTSFQEFAKKPQKKRMKKILKKKWMTEKSSPLIKTLIMEGTKIAANHVLCKHHQSLSFQWSKLWYERQQPSYLSCPVNRYGKKANKLNEYVKQSNVRMKKKVINIYSCKGQ